jgi:hypothetical protein
VGCKTAATTHRLYLLGAIGDTGIDRERVTEGASMKPIIVGLVMILGGAAATLAAQQAPPKPNEPAHKVFVLTGCLRAGAPATPAFKLSGAVPVGQAPERPASSSGANDVYELQPVSGLTEQGIGKAELDRHAGKKVEVTVRPVEVAPGPSPSTSSAAQAGKVDDTTPPRYTVTAIKPAPGTCAPE